MTFRVISLWQPWASLVAFNEKKLETRPQRCSFKNYRGNVLIHAAKHIDYEACNEPHIKAALKRHDIIDPRQLPTGVILALTKILDAGISDRHNFTSFTHPVVVLTDKSILEVNGDEFYFGDYEHGRTIMKLDNTIALSEPIPAKGMQGLWKWEGILPGL